MPCFLATLQAITTVVMLTFLLVGGYYGELQLSCKAPLPGLRLHGRRWCVNRPSTFPALAAWLQCATSLCGFPGSSTCPLCTGALIC